MAAFWLEKNYVLKFGVTGDVDCRIGTHLRARDTPWGRRMHSWVMYVDFGFRHAYQARHAESAIKRAVLESRPMANRFTSPERPSIPTIGHARECPSGEWMFLTECAEGPVSWLYDAYSACAIQAGYDHLIVPSSWVEAAA